MKHKRSFAILLLALAAALTACGGNGQSSLPEPSDPGSSVVSSAPSSEEPLLSQSEAETLAKEQLPLEIMQVKFFKNLVILKFKGIDNINDIEKYKGRDLWIPREEAQELEEDEYYIADLIGMDVVLEDGSKFGTLKDVMETGANDVYVVEDAKGEEILLPAIRECILDVDVEKNVMTIHLMKGLI